MKKSKTLVFFGNERIVTGLPTTAPTLQALISKGYAISNLVISQKDLASSRKANISEVSEVAKKHNITILSPKKLLHIKDELKAANAAAGVLVAYGKIIPQEIIDIFPAGIINIHPSLLPKHRGSTPIESAILEGDAQTGVSIMQLSSKMDAGPVFAQKTINLKGDEQKPGLARDLLNTGKDLLVNNLDQIIAGNLRPIPQDENSATYDSLIKKESGNIDVNKPAIQLEREIRAYSEWPKSRVNIGGLDVIVTTAVVVESNLKPGEILVNKDEILLGTDSDALKIIELMPLGKQKMPVKAFINGYKDRIAKKV